MSIKDKEGKKCRIFDKTTKQWFEVSSKEYSKYIRDINAIRSKMQDHGKCSCPKKSFWLCDGCCQGCEFETNIASSLDTSVADEMDYVDLLVDEKSNIDDIAVDRMVLSSLFKRLNELMPEAQVIGELRLQEATDEEIGEILNIKRTTFRSRLDKVKAILRSEFGEEFPF